MDIALGTQSYNLVFIEVLRFHHRFFVSSFAEKKIEDIKEMLRNVIDPKEKRMELFAYYPEQNGFTPLNDGVSLAEYGFKPDRSNFHQPGILYLGLEGEDPSYIANPYNKTTTAAAATEN